MQPGTPSNALSPQLTYNNRLLLLSRTIAALTAGIASGILGVSFIRGVILFIVFTGVSSGVCMLKTAGKHHKYFPSLTNLLYGQCLAGFLTFILFWTIFYDIVFIFK